MFSWIKRKESTTRFYEQCLYFSNKVCAVIMINYRFRLRVERAGGGWCPKQQVERGIREYLQVDLGGIHVVTGVQTQGRYDRGRGQEYAEEYTIEYWRPGFQEWKEYKRWDGKQVRH